MVYLIEFVNKDKPNLGMQMPLLIFNHKLKISTWQSMFFWLVIINYLRTQTGQYTEYI